MRHTSAIAALLLVAVLGAATTHARAAKIKRITLADEPADFRTQPRHESGTEWDDIHHDWTLGPTGARGWMWIRRGHEDSASSRQILVTQVDAGSPADGILRRGDVILGIDGKAFDSDARVALGKAIGVAETEEAGGKLRLLRWRRDGDGTKGFASNVTIQLEVMGAWAETAPFDCPKTRRIVEKACVHLRQTTRNGLAGAGLTAPATGLGLLATGRKEFLPIVQTAAREMAANPPDQVKSLCTWYYGMNSLMLIEYYLATGDEAVLPGLRRHLLDIAEGQPTIGTWGHRFKVPELDICDGYGALNAAGLPCAMSLALASEVGVDDPLVQRARQRSLNFFGNYAGQGGIPYGAHKPWPSDNNGKSSQAAVLFDFAGRERETAWFAKLSAGSLHERETGHTGNWLSFFWGPLGTARAGREALIAHFNQLRWYWDLERRWDGSILYQGRPTGRDGKTDKKSHKYYGWDCTGARLLLYCYPLHEIRLTGKRPSPAKPLAAAEAVAVVRSGIDDIDRRSLAELQAGCKSWNPWERERCAEALAARGAEHMLELIAQLGKGAYGQRAATAAAIGAYGPAAERAVDSLVAELAAADVELRLAAMEALRQIGPAAKDKALPVLLKLAAARIDNDPLHLTKRGIFQTLFGATKQDYGLAKDGFGDVDRALAVDALKGLLEDTDNAFDVRLVGVAYDHVKDWPLETLKPMLPAVVKSIAERTTSGQMGADNLPLAGTALLGELGIAEGLEAGIQRVCQPRSAWLLENGFLQDLAEQYGVAAKAYLPQLKAYRAKVALVNKPNKAQSAKDALEAGIEAIEKTTARKKLIRISDI